jgi:HSP20 family protein
MSSLILRNHHYWDPFRALAGWMADESLATSEPAFAPRFDVKEEKGEYVLSADLPGVKPEAVEIALEGDRLKVSGRRESSRKEESGQAYLSEICYGSFAREFSLPESVDSEHVQASLKDGVLTLHLPKKPESQPRKIAVKAS